MLEQSVTRLGYKVSDVLAMLVMCRSLIATRYAKGTPEQPLRAGIGPQGESITLGQPKASGEEQKMTRFFEAKKTKMPNTGVRHLA